MATGWHQLPQVENDEDNGDDEEKQESEVSSEGVNLGESSDEMDRGVNDSEGYSSVSVTGELPDNLETSNAFQEHHIDIGGLEDSFWGDEDERTPRIGGELSLIEVLAAELKQQTIPSYLEQFEVTIPEAELVIGAVPLEDVQQREREIEEANIRHRQMEVQLYQQREFRMAQREALAREELKREADRKHKQLLLEKRQFAQMMHLQKRRLGYVFQQAESHLKSVLRRQQARVSQVFGHLEHSNLPAERRQYRVEWDHIPVTMKVRAKMLRALKDKLPRGQYVLLATLYDRLGGHALHWTAWDQDTKSSSNFTRRRKRTLSVPQTSDQQGADLKSSILGDRVDRPHLTQPFRHRGRYFSTDVVINEDLYVVCPPQSQLRPGNVLVFELFLLETSTVRSRNHHIYDQIVAWGAVPLMTPEFSYVEGSFKVPFLKGEMDATMDKYRDIEDMYTKDLSAWLCNFYFRMTPMKDEIERVILDRREQAKVSFDVEVDERNAVLRLPPGYAEERDDRSENLRIRKKSHAFSDDTNENKPHPPTVAESTSGSSTLLLDDSDQNGRNGTTEKNRRRVWGFWAAGSRRTKKNRIYAGSVVAPQLNDNVPLPAVGENVATLEPTSSQRKLSLLSATPPPSQRSLFKSNSPRQSDIGEDEDDETAGVIDTENYRFSVNSSFVRESAHHVRFHASRKLKYMRHELFVDMGLRRHDVHKMEFWLLVAMFWFALWLRVYVHYVAQWVFLKAQGVAVFYFRPQWTTCVVKYTWRSVATHTEIGLIVAGVLGNWGFFAFLTLTAAVSQMYVGELPAFGSKFLICVGLATLLDPFLVLVVDIVNHQYNCGTRNDCLASLTAQTCRCVEGDAFKLYTRFLSQEGSGLVGIAITAIIYAALTSLSMVAFYMYLLHVHMNGRMLDVYRRIHAQETELFIPHDCEVPIQELKAICEEATRWKGPGGTQRKIFVHDYVLEDPLDSSYQEESTHIAIYTVGLEENGNRDLYRHFLKSPDGAIIELFGQVGVSREGAWQRDAVPGVVSNLALLHNILKDHPRRSPAPGDLVQASELATILNGRHLPA